MKKPSIAGFLLVILIVTGGCLSQRITSIEIINESSLTESTGAISTEVPPQKGITKNITFSLAGEAATDADVLHKFIKWESMQNPEVRCDVNGPHAFDGHNNPWGVFSIEIPPKSFITDISINIGSDCVNGGDVDEIGLYITDNETCKFNTCPDSEWTYLGNRTFTSSGNFKEYLWNASHETETGILFVRIRDYPGGSNNGKIIWIATILFP